MGTFKCVIQEGNVVNSLNVTILLVYLVTLCKCIYTSYNNRIEKLACYMLYIYKIYIHTHIHVLTSKIIPDRKGGR